jgi:uncharacterized YccA/Bax inhibitor family protein
VYVPRRGVVIPPLALWGGATTLPGRDMPMTTSNPAFQGTIYQDWAVADSRGTTMTIQGTAVKTMILLAITAVTAGFAWDEMSSGGAMMLPVMIGSAILGFIVAMVTIFKPTWAATTAPIYAALEGVFLGALSSVIEARGYKGIALQAVSLTMGTLFVMLVLYSTRVIKVTQRLATGIIAATGAIALLYFVTIILSFFHVSVPFIHSAGPIGIGFSLFVVALAAFNLLLDFDYIEKSAAQGAPKSMEWYGAFGLIVTLVWLYLEILRLLQKLQDRR